MSARRAFGFSKGFLDSLRARGCRPFSTKIEPLALFPSVSNPGMTHCPVRCGVPDALKVYIPGGDNM